MSDKLPTPAAARGGSIRPRWPALLSGACILLLLAASLGLIFHPAAEDFRLSIPGAAGAAGPDSVTHLMLLDFKDSVEAAQIREASSKMLDLKQDCIHPITSKPYIRSIRGGKNISPQDLHGGNSHAFVMEFNCPEHRDFFIEHDEIHQAFIKDIQRLLQRPAIIFEFHDGSYV